MTANLDSFGPFMWPEIKENWKQEVVDLEKYKGKEQLYEGKIQSE